MIELRTITIDFSSQTVVSSYLLGKIGEHNATKLSITPPTNLSGDARTSIYRVSFGTGGKTYLSESFTTTPFSVNLWKQLTGCPRMSIQIIAYDSDGEYVGKSDKLTGFYFESSINGIEVEVDGENHDIANEILKVKSDLASEVARAEVAEGGKVDKVSGKGLSTNDYTTAEKQKLNAQSVFYGTCSTAANQSSKIVTADSSFVLKNGVFVVVSFSNASGGDAYAPRYLNVNGTGDYPIRASNSVHRIDFIPFKANSVVTFLFEENKWVEVNLFYADNLDYGMVRLEDTLTGNYDVSWGRAATPKAVYDLNNKKVEKPSSSTPANYVPKSDGNGGYSWQAESGGGSGDVADVKVDGTSVVDENKVAQIDLSGKVDKVTGKSLSTNDYTTAEKDKLAGLQNYDDTGIVNRISAVETGKQATLPNGTNIGDLLVWNGTGWVVNEQSRLPSAYQEVEFIESTGTQYINLGIKGTSQTRISAIFEIYFDGNEGKQLWGARTAAGQGQFCQTLYYNSGTGQYQLVSTRYNATFEATQIQVGKGILTTNPCRISKRKFDIETVKDVSIYTKIENFAEKTAAISGDFSTILDLFLFGINHGGTVSIQGGSMKCYGFESYHNGIKTRNLIPCYRKSDNEIGMYDIVTNTFFTNQGTGTFLKGADV